MSERPHAIFRKVAKKAIPLLLSGALASCGIKPSDATVSVSPTPDNRSVPTRTAQEKAALAETTMALQKTPITELLATATARAELLNEGKEPVIFSPEHGFTFEDYKLVREATVILFLHAPNGHVLGLGTGWGANKDNGEIFFGTNSHVSNVDNLYKTLAKELENEYPHLNKEQLKNLFFERHGIRDASEIQVSVLRPGIDEKTLAGTSRFIYRNDIMTDGDIGVIAWQPDDPEIYNSIGTLPILPEYRLPPDEHMMILGYPRLMRDLSIEQPVDTFNYPETATLVEYAKLATHIRQPEKVTDPMYLTPWRNGAGGSGSPGTMKVNGELYVCAIFGGIVGYQDNNGKAGIVSAAYYIDDQFLRDVRLK